MVYCRDCGKIIRRGPGDCICASWWVLGLGLFIGLVLGLFTGLFVPLIWK